MVPVTPLATVRVDKVWLVEPTSKMLVPPKVRVPVLNSRLVPPLSSRVPALTVVRPV